MQSQYTAWITTLFVTGCIFTTIYLLVTRRNRYRNQTMAQETGKNIPCPDFWEYAILATALTLIAGTITLFILFFTTGDGLFLALGCASTIGMGLILFHWRDLRDGELTIYFKVTTGGIGIIATRTVQKTPDERYEVTLKDDLPQTDTTPQIERTIEYQTKGEEVAAGKEPCTEKNSRGNIGILPTCTPNNPNQTEARFTKTQTTIHIPAGSIDKTVTVTSE